MTTESTNMFPAARRILVFNPRKCLVAVLNSQSAAAAMLNTTGMNVSLACTGGTISCKGFYLRQTRDDVEIDLDADLGRLELTEYDRLCGEERRVYQTTNFKGASIVPGHPELTCRPTAKRGRKADKPKDKVDRFRNRLKASEIEALSAKS